MEKIELEKVSGFELKRNHSLKKFNTWGVDANAEMFTEVKTRGEFVSALSYAYKNKLKVTILGLGANVLIPDEGIKGLVVVNSSKGIDFCGENVDENLFIDENKPIYKEGSMYKFSDLDFEEVGDRELVKFDSGVKLSVATQKCFKNNLSGLQWFAKIPSTMGGALYNNIHGGSHHFSEYFYSAEIFDMNTGELKTVYKDFFDFGYDQSILRSNSELVVVSVSLGLIKSSDEQINKSKNVYNQWLIKKKLQPAKSAGCMFKNFSQEDRERLGFESVSTGWLIDKKLGLKGYQIGGAKISEYHAAFIENVGVATSSDIRQIIDLIKDRASKEFDLDLDLEIKIL